jgi:dolichyl-phosphate-mannose-protein mannosyltransferase
VRVTQPPTTVLTPAAAERNRKLLVIAGVLLVLALSAGVRFYALGRPAGYIFDEVYYAKDAKTIIDGKIGPKYASLSWEPGQEVSWPHPEYGKLAIALGILAFGNNAFGWRFVPALAGLGILCLVYPIARRMGLRRGWALAALILAASDMLGIAQSRIATLDVFIAVWTVLAVYLTLRYVQDGHRWYWLLSAGVAAGLAAGTKWSGAFAMLVAVVLVFLFRVRRPTQGLSRGKRMLRALRSAIAPAATLVVLPVGLYVASYAFYFAAGHTWGQWWELQQQAWYFNIHLSAPHTYASKAPSWILDIRPVWYYFKATNATTVYHGVVALGNPLLWWAATLSLATLPIVAIVDRDRRLAMPALIVALLYFPWFAATRTSFLYYMAPVAPFMAVLVATALQRLTGERQRWPRQRPSEFLAEPAGGHQYVSVLAFVAFALAGAVLWYDIGHGAAYLFWRLPSHASTIFAYFVSIVVGAIGCTAVAWLVTRVRTAAVWRLLGWAFVGGVAGIGVAYLPIIIDIGISPAHYYHLMWFQSWI